MCVLSVGRLGSRHVTLDMSVMCWVTLWRPGTLHGCVVTNAPWVRILPSLRWECQCDAWIVQWRSWHLPCCEESIYLSRPTFCHAIQHWIRSRFKTSCINVSTNENPDRGIHRHKLLLCEGINVNKQHNMTYGNMYVVQAVDIGLRGYYYVWAHIAVTRDIVKVLNITSRPMKCIDLRFSSVQVSRE